MKKQRIFLSILFAHQPLSCGSKKEHERPALPAQTVTLKIKHPYFSQKKDAKKLGDRLTHNLHTYLQSITPTEHSESNASALIGFMRELTGNNKMRTYFPTIDNDVALFRRLYSCIADGILTINVLTCPDYSGNSEEDGTWTFDFKSVGNTEGFIARRSHNYIKELYLIASKYISDVRIHHYLPSFEFFPDGFTAPDQKLTYTECLEQLEGSARSIHMLYDTSKLPAQVTTTNTLMNEEDFLRHKQAYLEKIKTENIPHPEWKMFRAHIFKLRKPLYRRFYPQDSTESPEDYEKRLYSQLEKQIAEYCADGELLTKDPHSLLVVSDSPLMSEVYGLHQQPVIFGKSATEAAYTGE